MSHETATASAPSGEGRDAGRPWVVRRDDGLEHLEPTHARAFLGLVRAGDGLFRALDAELRREHGLGLHGFEVLLHLAVFSDDGQLRMKQLVEQAPLSQSRVSRLVDELERDGLVERLQSEADARGVNVSITPAGIDVFRAAQDTHLAGLDVRLFSHLSAEEIAQLAEITERILEHLDR